MTIGQVVYLPYAVNDLVRDSHTAVHSSPSLENAHHLPRRLPQEDLCRGDVGAPLQADGAAHCNRAERRVHEDRNAASAAFAADDLHEMARGSRHSIALCRAFPDTGKAGDKDFRGPVCPSRAADTALHAEGERRNSSRKAWNGGAALPAFHKSLACLDLDCHDRRVAPQAVDWRIKSEYKMSLKLGTESAKADKILPFNSARFATLEIGGYSGRKSHGRPGGIAP